MKYGKLRVKTMALAMAKALKPSAVKVSVNGKAVDASLEVKDDKVIITLAADAVVRAGESLVATVA